MGWLRACSHTCFKVKRSGSSSPLMLTDTVRHIFRMPRPTNFKLGTVGKVQLVQYNLVHVPSVTLKSIDYNVAIIIIIQYTDGGRWPQSATGAMTSKVKGQGHVTSLSCVGPMANKSINRKRIVVVKGHPMTRATLRTSFKVKRSKIEGHRPINADTQNVPNGKA